MVGSSRQRTVGLGQIYGFRWVEPNGLTPMDWVRWIESNVLSSMGFSHWIEPDGFWQMD